MTGWHNDIRGVPALVAAGSRTALSVGYGPDYDRLALTELGGDRARPAGEYRIVLPGGQPLSSATQVIARGPRLHFLMATDWYQHGVGDIPGRTAR